MIPATAIAPPQPPAESFGERVRAWLSPLNLHWIGVALLVIVNLYLLAQMALLWQSASSHNADALAEQRIQLHDAEIAARPLRGLDAKLENATAEADRFYDQRLPASDSQMISELGALSRRQSVRLIRVSYTEAAVLPGSAGELTEVKMDASLSGDYRPLVQFMNALERDPLFFLIDGVTLNGQQSGTVNLRLRLTTYLREPGMLNAPGATGIKSASLSSSAPSSSSSGGPGR
jgi:type IV pilus assembly protein PilO